MTRTTVELNKNNKNFGRLTITAARLDLGRFVCCTVDRYVLQNMFYVLEIQYLHFVCCKVWGKAKSDKKAILRMAGVQAVTLSLVV
jgi:hypothetical protein